MTSALTACSLVVGVQWRYFIGSRHTRVMVGPAVASPGDVDPQIIAAWITAGLAITAAVVGAIVNWRHGSRALRAQAKQSKKQLKTQSDLTTEQLNAQARQQGQALALEQERLLTERFGRAAEQLGSDAPAVRLAGVYAMAALADGWESQRTQCVDVLCAMLRLPPRGQTGDEQVRSTVVNVLAEHLQEEDGTPSRPGWHAVALDLRGAEISDLDFSGIAPRGSILFDGAQFRGRAAFDRAVFHRYVSFRRASFDHGAQFFWSQFKGALDCDQAHFMGRTIMFNADFSASPDFSGATFDFLDVSSSTFLNAPRFAKTTFHRGADFEGIELVNGAIDLTTVEAGSHSRPKFTLPDGSMTTGRPVIEANAPAE